MFAGRVTRAVLLIPFLAGVASSSAIASPGFPSVVQQTLHLPQAPDCTLCHGLGKTGFWTVSTAFGTAMLRQGALAGDSGTIQAALITLQAQQSPLISDLIAGRDPNRPAGDPRYGCGSNVAPGFPGAAQAWPLLVVFWLGGRRAKK